MCKGFALLTSNWLVCVSGMENDLEFFEEKLMLPPAPGTFQDREELIKHVREFGACQGYVVTIKKSRKDRRVILGCDRGGVYRNRRKVDEGNRKRKANSRLINCPFEAIGKKDDDVWVLTIRNGEHNHEPLRDMSDHPYSRRFTEDEIRKIKQMTEAGVKPRQVLKALKQSNPELQSTPRHLYNLKAKIRQGKLSEKNFKSWRPNKSIPLSISIEESTKDACLKKVPNYIGGKCVESVACEYIDVINPATQEVVSQVPVTTYDEFKAAVAAARQAFPAWRNTPVTVRQRIMFKFQELIRRDIDKIVMNIAIEQGKTLNGAKGDVLRGLEVVEQSCGMVTLQMGEFIPNATSGVDTFCIREPLGVCAGICPLNLPAMISLWMFPIAVTCGNTFVLKPSVKNPGASMILAALAAEAGLPDGVLNVVHGTQEIINYICDDDDIKAISLVGSNSAGMDTYARAVTRGKRVQSNMGAKNHAIIMPDASADVTLDSIIAAGFGAAGQRCMTLSTLIFVGGSAPWETELVDRAKALKVNAGTEVGTDLGPVISKEAKDHICRLVQNGVERGARLLIDGRNVVVPKYENGNFLGPTILCSVSTDMECYKEEMFGPVLLCMQADNLEEAIAIVNRNRYGNGAAIFTTSGVAARKFQNDVESGLVGINVAVPIPMPFSTVNGSKASFAGDLNFCGKAGVQFYTLVKTIASQWRDLPSRRVAFPHPPTSEAKVSSRGVLLVQPLSHGSDLLGREVSAATALASPKDLPSDGFYLPLSSPTSEVLPSTPPTREPELPRQDVSFFMPSTSERETMDPKVLPSFPIAGQSGSMALHSDSEGAYLQHTSQWGDSLPNSQGMIQSTDDLEDSERLYFPMSYSNDVAPIFLRNESLSPTSLSQDIQMTEMNPDPSSDAVYIPMMPRRTDNHGSAPHETNTMLQMRPEKIYMPSLGSDGVGLMSLMSDATETGSLYMPAKPDDVCLASDIGSGVVASASDRLFMPESSQGIYDQTSLLSTHDYSGQEISEHPQPLP